MTLSAWRWYERLGFGVWRKEDVPEHQLVIGQILKKGPFAR
jgi:hypothetical protein